MNATETAKTKPVSYSTSLNYIFIHIPKCAGTSIHRALRAAHTRASLPIASHKYHKHSKAIDVRPSLGPLWSRAFKFAFVRNPWDLMVSSYHWWLNVAEDFPRLRDDAANVRALGTFDAFIRSDYGSNKINECAGRDFTDWLCDENGKVIVDLVGKYETLAQDWERVCDKLRIEPIGLTKENEVPRPHYRTFYDDASRDLVAKRFARSIELFEYAF